MAISPCKFLLYYNHNTGKTCGSNSWWQTPDSRTFTWGTVLPYHMNKIQRKKYTEKKGFCHIFYGICHPNQGGQIINTQSLKIKIQTLILLVDYQSHRKLNIKHLNKI